jgi:NADH-quinone oxidoreductase subunit N
MNYPAIFTALLPDLIVVVALFAALGVDYTKLRGASLACRACTASRIGGFGLVAALVVLGCQLTGSLAVEGHALEVATQGQLVLNTGTLALKGVLFLLGLLVLPLAARTISTPQVSEYFALLLLATLGMGFMVTSLNLLGAFVALELVSLSLYALTALNPVRKESAEAALKYFTYGGVASAFLLFGISYLFGTLGKLDITQATLAEAPRLVVVAYLFILVGLGFKLALAPFHLWAPDVYQAAPTPAAAWIASGSKIAGVALLLALLGPVSLPSAHSTIVPLLLLMAVASMAVGNLGALRQANVKRLLAYSAIANAGYILVAVVAFTDAGRAAAMFYAIVYAIATLGAFAVVSVWNDRLGREALIDDFRGAWKTSPGLSLALLVFVLSLAGIPPLAGFVGKFYLFYAAIHAAPQMEYWSDGLYWLVAVALAFSVVALYYYLKILKAVFVREETGEMDNSPVGLSASVAILVLALLTVVLGVWPEPVVDYIQSYLF